MQIGFKSCMINRMFEPKSRFSFHTINCFDKGTNKFDDKGLYFLVFQKAKIQSYWTVDK